MQYFLDNQNNLSMDGFLTSFRQRGSDQNTCTLAQRLHDKKIKYLVIDPNIGTVVMGGGNSTLFDRFLAKIDKVNGTIVKHGTMTMLAKMVQDGYLKLTENDRLPGIGVRELVFGVPHYRIVNAVFTHAHPLGSRFNGPDRGAWYAAFDLRTSQAEVAFHKTVQLAEIGRFEDAVTFDDYLADFSGEFHDLRDAAAFSECLQPASYVKSQVLAERLLDAGSLGIVYPSVRNEGGTCIACFRPALVTHVHKGKTYRFEWRGAPKPVIEAG